MERKADVKVGELDVLVTAPVNKNAMDEAGFGAVGHTEFLAQEFGGEPLMLMCSDIMRVGLATIHLPVAEVAQALSKELIVKRIGQLHKSLREDFGVRAPRIAVLALNPHAGDGGLLGKEEQEIITPAIKEVYEGGTLAFGPFAADGFFAAGTFKKYDAVLAMYHDQGLAPFKTLTPYGVNVTTNLEVVRTTTVWAMILPARAWPTRALCATLYIWPLISTARAFVRRSMPPTLCPTLYARGVAARGI